MKRVCLLLALVALLAVSAGAEVIGYEPFNYADGPIGGLSGGIGWDWDGVSQVHTGTFSDWSAGPTVVNGSLETNNSTSLRQYNGPGEGSGENPDTDERLGAIRGGGVVYYAVTCTQLVDNPWAGFSGYDFGAERIFFGMPGGQKNFGLDQSGVGNALTSIPVVVGRSYRLIGAIDFDSDQLLLWVNPGFGDFHDRAARASSADAVRNYTEGNWNTAIRLGSGGQTRWDDLIVATTFEEALISPARAGHPSPDPGSASVGVEAPVLSWSQGVDPNGLAQDLPGVVSYKLYFAAGADPNVNLVDTIEAGENRIEYALGSNLDYNTEYSWRVDTILSDDSVVTGLIWNFRSEPSTPVISAVSAPQAVAEGDTATIAVTATCPFPITYQWYKVAEGGDIMLSDGDMDISGAETAELSIANMELADESFYYCIVTNDRQEAAQSGNAFLAMQRMIAYWPFEAGSFQSEVQDSPACEMYGDPEFVAGKVGDAMYFDGDGDIVTMAYGSGSYADICDYGMTVVGWVKTDVGTGWNGYITRDGEDGRGWQIRQRNGDKKAAFTTRCTSSNVDGSSSNTTIGDGNWHLVAATFDLQAGVKKLYVDGRLEKTDTVSSPMNGSRASLALGGRQRDSGVRDGFGRVALDEVQVFNYPLSSRDVARIYTQVETDVMICVEDVLPAMDLNGNCIVDLADLVLFVNQWLDSNWVH